MSFLNQVAQYSSDFYYDSPSTSSGADTALGLGLLLFVFLIMIAVYVFFSFCLMKIFEKAKRKDSWAAWVPFYNTWVLYEIAGRPGWWVLLSLIPFVGGIIGFVLSIIVMIDLSKSFKKESWFTVLLVLLPVVAFPMLAFGPDKYHGPAGPEGQKVAAK